MMAFHSSSASGRNEKPDDKSTEEHLTKSQKKRRQKRARERARKEAVMANDNPISRLTFSSHPVTSYEPDNVTALPSLQPEPATFDERWLLPMPSLRSSSDPALPLKDEPLEGVRDSSEALLPATEEYAQTGTNYASAAGDDVTRPSFGKRFVDKASKYFSRVKPVSNVNVSNDGAPYSSLSSNSEVGGGSSSGGGSIPPLPGLPVDPRTGWPRLTTSLRRRASTASSEHQSIDIIDAILNIDPETGQLDGGPSISARRQNPPRPHLPTSDSSQSLDMIEAITQMNPKTGVLDRAPRPRVPLIAPTNTRAAVPALNTRPVQNHLDQAIAAKVAERSDIDANIEADLQRTAAIDDMLERISRLRADVVRLVTLEQQSAARDAELLEKHAQANALMHQVRDAMNNSGSSGGEGATTMTKEAAKKDETKKGKKKAVATHNNDDEDLDVNIMHRGYGPLATHQLLPAFPAPANTTMATGSAALPSRHRRDQYSRRGPVVNTAQPVRMVPRDLEVVELRRGRVVARDVVGAAMVMEEDLEDYGR